MAAQSSSDVDVSAVDSTPLDIDDLFDVQSELNPIASSWKSLGLALRLKHDVLEIIQAGNPGNPTACLTVTLKEYLNRNYSVKKFGEPTWQHLVEAVRHPVGGANVALATKIARNHKAKVPATSELMVTQQTSPGSQEVTETQRKQDEEVVELTSQNKRNMTAKYAALLANVYSRLQQRGIDVRKFRLFVVARFPPGDCIPHTADLAEIFEAITRNGLWNFLNYQPLEDIVQHFGADDEQLKDWVKEYKADLVGFKACTKIVHYLAVVESDSSFDESESEQPTLPKPARYHQEYYRKLSLKLKVKVTDQSLSYIDDIWRSVSEYLLLMPLLTLLDRIREGCITVVWLIPTGLVPRLLKRIRQAGDFFQQHHIASVTLDDRCVYDEEISTVEQRQTIVDPQQLFQACEQGDLEVALRLLATDVDVDIKDTLGRTPLILASYNGHLGISSLLIGCGATVNAQDEEGWTPLLMSSYHGDSRICMLLLANQADVNAQTEDGQSALYASSFNGHSDVVRLLIMAGANPDIQKKDGFNALHVACQEGHYHVAELLLQAGASLEQETETGQSALFLASWKGHQDIVAQLLKNGASVNQQKEDGESPIYISSFYGHSEIVKLLLTAGANPDIQKKDDTSPVSVASQEGHKEVVQMLIEHGAHINSQDKTGQSALFIASWKGHQQIVAHLLKNGADVDQQKEDGVSALRVAAQNGHLEVARMLIENSANVNCQGNDGITPLWRASSNGHTKVVKLLLTSGAIPDIQDKNGWSPLMVASRHDHHEIVKVLIEQGANINSQNKSQITVLMVVSYHGKIQVMKELLAAGALADIQDNIGRSALSIASQQGHSDIVSLLADSGTQMNLKTREGRTALALASWDGHMSVVQVLVAKGADVDVQDEEGLTALILAIKQGHTEIVRELVHHGKADVNIQERSTRWSALFFAAKDGNLGLTRLLIEGGANVWLKDKSEVTALDVAKVFNHEDVIQELTSQMSSVRQHEHQRTTMEMKELVLSARKFLQTIFSRVERNILKTRTLKREMAENISHSTHEEPQTMRITSDK